MKITVVTGSRADWNGLGMVARDLVGQDNIILNVLATGQHAHSQSSRQTIMDDGFVPMMVIDAGEGGDPRKVARVTGSVTKALAGPLAGLSPDIVLLAGDRFEILGAATAASLLNIPIAHIGGGDLTEGSIDNKLRYAITALSDLHFVSTQGALRRVVACGFVENREAYCTGSPALDRIAIRKSVPRETVFNWMETRQRQINILVTYHAATREPIPEIACNQMIEALLELDQDRHGFIVLGTNEDAGSAAIAAMLRLFAARPNAVHHDNVAPDVLYALFDNCDCMVGNSSAAICETAASGIPVVNVGSRQTGRIAPANVTTCAANKAEISRAIENSLMRGRWPCENPYGGGMAAPRIARIIVDRHGDY